MNEYDQRKLHLKRWEGMHTKRSLWDTQWRKLAQFIAPRRSRFWTWEVESAGVNKNQYIINGIPIWALRTLAAGMMAGVTSPARTWFRMTTPDPDLADQSEVKAWLDEVVHRMLLAMARGGIYNALHTLYGDLALFGVSPLFIDSDPDDLLRAYTIPIGEYCLAQSGRGKVDTMYRLTSLTVGELVKRFGIDKCSNKVRTLHSRGDLEERVEVLHAIYPREDYDRSIGGPKNMPFASVWFERANADDSGFLLESGFEEFPCPSPRWMVNGNNIYGDSPGMDALGDAQALQLYERRKAQAVEKMIDPPLVGPSTLNNRPVSLLPGAKNWVAESAAQAKIEPLLVVPPQAIEVTDAAIRAHEERIKQAFYADLWLMLSQEQEGGSPITAREVAERHEEKMLQLGPVMERLEDELLTPLVERVFGIMLRAGRLPPIPASLHGREIRVEYLSIMAQAQKMVGAGSLQQLAGFVANLATLKPDVVDKIDTDKMVDLMADAVGASPEVIRPDDEVAKDRAARAQQQAAEQQAQQAMAQTQAAKNLSQADLSGDNGLSRLVGPVPSSQAGGR